MKSKMDSASMSEAEWLKNYDFAAFPGHGVTVDPVILTVRQGRLCVLLVKRGAHPFLGYWALPGGFKRPDETLESAAWRELKEETNLEATPLYHLEQLGSYSDPKRDPRGPIISIPYVALIPDLGAVLPGSDAEMVRFWAVDEVLSNEGPTLAFDHVEILGDAVARARAKLEYTSVAAAFLEPTFTMGDLRHIYEVVWGVKLDPPNFRDQVLANVGFVVPTGEDAVPTSAGGRPTPLYHRGDIFWLKREISRPNRQASLEGRREK